MTTQSQKTVALILSEHTKSLQLIRQAMQEQSKSIEIALESENKAVHSMLSELNEKLDAAIPEMQKRIISLENTLHAYILLTSGQELPVDQREILANDITKFLSGEPDDHGGV